MDAYGPAVATKLMEHFADQVAQDYLISSGWQAYLSMSAGLYGNCEYADSKRNDICSPQNIIGAAQNGETYNVLEIEHNSPSGLKSARQKLLATEAAATAVDPELQVHPIGRNESNTNYGDSAYFPDENFEPVETVVGLSLEWEIQESGVVFFYMYGDLDKSLSPDTVVHLMDDERNLWDSYRDLAR